MRLLSQIKAVLASNPSLADAPCEVDSVEVRRNEKNPTRTKDYVVERAFKAAKNAKTLRELSDAIQAGALNLEGLESYNAAKITLDTTGKDNEKVKVVVDLDEMKVGRVWRFGAEIDTKKRADLSAKLGIRNKFGHGELLQFEGSVVPARSVEDYSLKADFELPQVFGGVGRWSNSFNFLTQNSITSQLIERDAGFTSSAQLNARHNFTYSLLRRKLFLKTVTNKKADEKEGEASSATITTLPANVPIPDAKDTVSSSISHTFTLNKLNDDDFPSKGYLFRARNTLAGLYGGDVRFFKSELEASTFFPIIRSLVANLQFTVGSAIPFEKTQKISISDKFFEPLRGYPNLLGPVDPNTNTIVGGNFKSTLLARLNFPLSFFPVLRDFLNAQGHFFFNAGNVADFDFSKADDSNYADAFYKSFVDTMKMSYGLGLFIVLSGVRLEVNYTVPIQSTEKGVDASYKNGKIGLYVCNNV